MMPAMRALARRWIVALGVVWPALGCRQILGIDDGRPLLGDGGASASDASGAVDGPSPRDGAATGDAPTGDAMATGDAQGTGDATTIGPDAPVGEASTDGPGEATTTPDAATGAD